MSVVKSGDAHGLEWVVLLVNGSHHCGYVKIPDGHVLHGASGSDCIPTKVCEDLGLGDTGGAKERVPWISVFCNSVNDGLISLDCVLTCHGGITYAGDLNGKGEWWLGFDCAHSGDRTKWSPDGVFRSAEYVQGECERLAQQIASYAGPKPVERVWEESR